MQNTINIIIPAYNAHKTINRTLASIAMQAIVDDIEVVIVNDASDRDYSEFTQFYAKFFKIKEVKMQKNGGPGVARQVGVDNSNAPFVTFIDADDTFAGSFVLKELRNNLLRDPSSAMVSGIFAEEQNLPNGQNMYLPHKQDMVWMFGKMYRRDFLNKYNIRFNHSRANEDNGFNKLVQLCSSDQEKVVFSEDVIYFWHANENSITRINNCEYSYHQSFPGYTDNMIYAITEANKRQPFNGYIKMFTVEVMCNLYEYYIEAVVRDPRWLDENLDACKRFYHKCYKKIESDITPEVFAQVYNNVMRNAYMGDKLQGIIPAMSIHEFMDKLKADEDYTDITLVPIPKGEYEVEVVE
jgi:glycosyltransferase involved in cell wall biosynthesis